MGSIRLFVETEAAEERARVEQLARDAAEAAARVGERERALRARAGSPRGSSPRSSHGQSSSPRDRPSPAAARPAAAAARLQ